MKQCEMCQTESIKRKGARFCSKKCSSASRRRDQICANPRCGKHFHPPYGRGRGANAQKYCSTECRGAVRRKPRVCAKCGNLFERKHHGQPTYCSPKCFAEGRRKGRNLEPYRCYRCGKLFERYPSTVRNPERVFCSGKCRDSSRVYLRGEDHPQWKGGTYKHAGYIYEVDYSNKKINGEYGYKQQHVRVMEEYLGRKLVKGEHVHHLDGDKLHNEITNLILLTSEQHRKVHGFYSQEFQREHALAGNIRQITEEFLATIVATSI